MDLLVSLVICHSVLYSANDFNSVVRVLCRLNQTLCANLWLPLFWLLNLSKSCFSVYSNYCQNIRQNQNMNDLLRYLDGNQMVEKRN